MSAERMMVAVFIEGAGKLRVGQMPVPEPGPREVLVAMRSVGVCGSDLHYYEHGRLTTQVITEPLVLGHECAGEVVALGPDVGGLRAGDLVSVEMGVPCQRCGYCLGGRYNLCRQMVFKGTPPRNHGAFREYMTSPEGFAHKLPQGVTAEMGATVEPLAVGLHALDLVALRPGESVLVLGAGPIGLMAVAAARAAGAVEVTSVDVMPLRLEFARRMGASRAVDASQMDVVDAFGSWADVVLDCVGSQLTLGQCFDLVRWGGRVAWIGMASDVAHVPMMKAVSKEVRISTVFRYAGVYPRAIRLLAEGAIDTAPLITHRFPFPRVEEALRFASANRDRAVKTMVNFG